jgi:parallel beta-helix repeat protein
MASIDGPGGIFRVPLHIDYIPGKSFTISGGNEVRLIYVSTKRMAAAILALSMLCIPGLVPMPSSAADLTWTGDTTISTSRTQTGDIINMTGNLTITGTLTLIGSELRMNCPDNGCYTILVKSGGTLNILAGSNVHAVDPDAHFLFRVQNGATLNMNASELHDCGWDDFDNWTVNAMPDRGLYIDSDKVSITNSTISRNCVGITVNNSRSPFIYKNNITDNDASGIEAYNGATPVIDHNLIRGNIRNTINWQSGGIMSDSSSPDITNNTISANIDLYQQWNTLGILLVNGGSPVIMYNTITGHKQGASTNVAGIGGWSCTPTIFKNNITDNGNGMIIQSSSMTVGENVFDNNRISGVPTMGYGVYDDGASTFTNNTYTRNNIGICLVDGSSSIYENENLTSNTRAGIDSDTWGRGYTVTMTNCTFSKNGQDVFLEGNGGGGPGSTLTLVTPSYNPALVRITDITAMLKVQWYLRARVIYENGSMPVEAASVNASNAKGVVEEQTDTGADGWTPRLLLDEYSKTAGGSSMKTPYKIHARKGEISNFTGDVMLNKNLDVTVVLDDIDPTIRITGPAPGALTNQTSMRITGICEPGVTVTVNGVQGTVAPNGSWSAQVPLEFEGANDIMAEARDAALNKAWDSMTVFRDTITPVVTLTAPKTGFLTNQTSISVEGSTTDPAANTTVNGMRVQVATNGSFRITFNLVEGPNTLAVESRDAAGNLARAEVSGVLDTTPPELAVLDPREGYATNRTSVWIRGNVEEGAILTMNGRVLKTDGVSFALEVLLDEGNNTYAFTAKDKAGNMNYSQLTVKKDSLPPLLAITYPAEGALVNSSTLIVRGTTEPGAILRINDELVDFEGPSFCITVELANQGPNTITLEVFDALRNGVGKTLTVNLDSIPPPLTVKSPANGTLTNQTSIELRGRTDPGSILRINGLRTWVDRDGCFSAVVDLTQEGANTFTIVSSDAAGNSEPPVVVTVFRDTAVNYTIDSPKNGVQVKTRNITVSGRVEPGSSVTVAGMGISPRADGTFSYDLQLVDGSNLISVNLRDRAGNTASEVIQVTKLKAPKTTVSKGFIPGFETVLILAALALSTAIVVHRKR